MKIKIPAGFEVPPDTDEEGEFTVVAEFKDNGDGTITLLEIDGSKVGGEEEEEVVEETETMPMNQPGGMYGRAKASGVPMKEM